MKKTLYPVEEEPQIIWGSIYLLFMLTAIILVLGVIMAINDPGHIAQGLY